MIPSREVGGISSPFFPEVARGVLDNAQQAGYNVFVCNSDGEFQREIRTLHSLAHHAVDGIIFFPSFEIEGFLLTFAAQGQPVVRVNRPLGSEWVSRVMIRSREGARLATEYLIRKGHRAVGMLREMLSDPSVAFPAVEVDVELVVRKSA